MRHIKRLEKLNWWSNNSSIVGTVHGNYILNQFNFFVHQKNIYLEVSVIIIFSPLQHLSSNKSVYKKLLSHTVIFSLKFKALIRGLSGLLHSKIGKALKAVTSMVHRLWLWISWENTHCMKFRMALWPGAKEF